MDRATATQAELLDKDSLERTTNTCSGKKKAPKHTNENRTDDSTSLPTPKLASTLGLLTQQTV